MFTKLKNYFNEARHELRSVQWPARQEAIKLTSLVIGISFALALFLGVFDTLFSYLIRIFVIKG